MVCILPGLIVRLGFVEAEVVRNGFFDYSCWVKVRGIILDGKNFFQTLHFTGFQLIGAGCYHMPKLVCEFLEQLNYV